MRPQNRGLLTFLGKIWPHRIGRDRDQYSKKMSSNASSFKSLNCMMLSLLSCPSTTAFSYSLAVKISFSRVRSFLYPFCSFLAKKICDHPSQSEVYLETLIMRMLLISDMTILLLGISIYELLS